MSDIPECFYHYYEAESGPFRTLSELPKQDGERVLQRIRCEGSKFASKRDLNYMKVRRELEDRARRMFIEKGGKPKRETPLSLTFGECPWVRSWYKEGREICIPVADFDRNSLSFTYGDLFPAMNCSDGKPYRGMVYTFDEIVDIIKIYGLPQEWNCDGRYGPEKYIEVQLWDDEPVKKYRKGVENG